MATSKAAETEVVDNRDDSTDNPLIDPTVQAVKKLIARAKDRGYITYNELNKVLPPDDVSSEQIEDTMTLLSEMGINVVESEETEETTTTDGKKDGEGAGSENPAPPNTTTTTTQLDRTDDPVRMYLKQMGQVPLLTREQEVEISKRIEDAELCVQKFLHKFGFTSDSYLALA
ncbi:MAG TPA: hypothetical protein EYQ81_06415, partial [Sneathiellales bacterium]|nr:hypothetical protein [Sneathiellales bacterium]